MSGSRVAALQHDAVNQTVPVSMLLLRAKAVAITQGRTEALQWIEPETRGYSGSDATPGYRNVSAILRVRNPFSGLWQPLRFESTDATLSDDALRDALSSHFVPDSVTQLEAYVQQQGREGGDFEFRISEAQLRQLRRMTSLPPGLQPAAIRLGAFVDASVFHYILGAVRNRILDWAFEIDEPLKHIVPLPYNGSKHHSHDVFISHASEDKSSFVEPLALALDALGVRVWYDRFVLRVGDSLSRKIDEGLRDSKYGILVLSKNFFKKHWTETEYRTLLSQQNIDGIQRILPVWHGITRSDVAQYSPLLVDIFAIDSAGGITNAVADLVEVIRPDLAKTNSGPLVIHGENEP